MDNIILNTIGIILTALLGLVIRKLWKIDRVNDMILIHFEGIKSFADTLVKHETSIGIIKEQIIDLNDDIKEIRGIVDRHRIDVPLEDDRRKKEED